jgi:hypothetical protein
VIVGITGGILSIACRVAIQAIALRDAVRAYQSGDARIRWRAYGQAAALIGFIAASLSVGSFGAPLILSYLFLGMMVRNPQRVPVTQAAVIRRNRMPNTTVSISPAASIA